jgi:hypothetical protein
MAHGQARRDKLFTADMAPHVYANGSVLLVYKARGHANTTCRGGWPSPSTGPGRTREGSLRSSFKSFF